MRTNQHGIINGTYRDLRCDAQKVIQALEMLQTTNLPKKHGNAPL